jgi:hypothetical protein
MSHFNISAAVLTLCVAAACDHLDPSPSGPAGVNLAVAHGKAATETPSADVWRQLARVRAATARYHDFEAALADGYVPFFPCEEEPGRGAMGERWINFGLLDAEVNELRPELLHYLPTSRGPKLLAVEYTLPLLIDGMPWFGGELPSPLPPNPKLFGGEVEMLGPFFEDPSAPWHYNLFAWLWRGNPAGIFEPLNPNVHCP